MKPQDQQLKSFSVCKLPHEYLSLTVPLHSLTHLLQENEFHPPALNSPEKLHVVHGDNTFFVGDCT